MRLLSRVLNRSLDALFAGPIFDQAWKTRLNEKAVCFCFHRIDDPNNHSFLTLSGYPAVSPEELSAQIRFMKSKGFSFITFKDLAAKGGIDPSGRYVILTFDDCFKTDYINGIQVFDDCGVKAVFFQATGMVESEYLFWENAVFWYCRRDETRRRFAEAARAVMPDDPVVLQKEGPPLAHHLVECVPFDRIQKVLEAVHGIFPAEREKELASELYPTRKHIADAVAAGHELGSHGHHHYKRANESAEVFEQDLRHSIERMQAWTGQTPISYAYPHGNFLPGDDIICSRYFKYVVTSQRGIIEPHSDPMELPRFYWMESSKNLTRRKRWLMTGVS